MAGAGGRVHISPVAVSVQTIPIRPVQPMKRRKRSKPTGFSSSHTRSNCAQKKKVFYIFLAHINRHTHPHARPSTLQQCMHSKSILGNIFIPSWANSNRNAAGLHGTLLLCKQSHDNAKQWNEWSHGRPTELKSPQNNDERTATNKIQRSESNIFYNLSVLCVNSVPILHYICMLEERCPIFKSPKLGFCFDSAAEWPTIVGTIGARAHTNRMEIIKMR